jgi:hypothetical protein
LRFKVPSSFGVFLFRVDIGAIINYICNIKIALNKNHKEKQENHNYQSFYIFCDCCECLTDSVLPEMWGSLIIFYLEITNVVFPTF